MNNEKLTPSEIALGIVLFIVIGSLFAVGTYMSALMLSLAMHAGINTRDAAQVIFYTCFSVTLAGMTWNIPFALVKDVFSAAKKD